MATTRNHCKPVSPTNDTYNAKGCEREPAACTPGSCLYDQKGKDNPFPRKRHVQALLLYTINTAVLLYCCCTTYSVQYKERRAKKHSTSLKSRFPVFLRGTTIRSVTLAVPRDGKITKPASPCTLPRFVPAVAKHSARRRDRDEGVTGP